MNMDDAHDDALRCFPSHAGDGSPLLDEALLAELYHSKIRLLKACVARKKQDESRSLQNAITAEPPSDAHAASELCASSSESSQRTALGGRTTRSSMRLSLPPPPPLPLQEKEEAIEGYTWRSKPASSCEKMSRCEEARETESDNAAIQARCGRRHVWPPQQDVSTLVSAVAKATASSSRRVRSTCFTTAPPPPSAQAATVPVAPPLASSPTPSSRRTACPPPPPQPRARRAPNVVGITVAVDAPASHGAQPSSFTSRSKRATETHVRRASAGVATSRSASQEPSVASLCRAYRTAAPRTSTACTHSDTSGVASAARSGAPCRRAHAKSESQYTLVSVSAPLVRTYADAHSHHATNEHTSARVRAPSVEDSVVSVTAPQSRRADRNHQAASDVFAAQVGPKTMQVAATAEEQLSPPPPPPPAAPPVRSKTRSPDADSEEEEEEDVLISSNSSPSPSPSRGSGGVSTSERVNTMQHHNRHDAVVSSRDSTRRGPLAARAANVIHVTSKPGTGGINMREMLAHTRQVQ